MRVAGFDSAASDIKLRSFGKETLLFHTASGDTHLLSETAAVLLAKLMQQEAGRSRGLSRDDLIEYTATQLNFERDDAFEEHVSEVISELVKRDILKQLCYQGSSEQHSTGSQLS